MPPRAFSLDLSRTSYVCQSCLASLRGGHPSTHPWLTRHVSSVARRNQPRRTATLPKSNLGAGATSTGSFRKLLEKLESGEAPNSDDLALVEQANVPDESVSVRYFDQDPSGKVQQLRDGDEFSRINSGLDNEVETAINQLEEQMLNTVQMLKQMENEGMQDRAEELRKQFKKSLRIQYKGKIGPEAEEYGLLRITGFTPQKQRSIAALNRFLARESVVKGGIPKQKDLVECWKYYSAARKALSSAWGKVPREVWDFLWMVLSWDGAENPNRLHHIYVLAKDMNAAGVVLRDAQQLLAIEAMFVEGWKDEAVEAWKKTVVTLGSKPETFKGYHELGVRMLALQGDTERAQRTADTLLRSAQDPDARILIPIIRALSRNDATADQAWESYRDMRELLGETMNIEDYDEVVASFLETNRMEHALQAFVDMMFSGAIDIRGKTRLPIAVSNQFFIGKWLKRLIGAGDLDGAYKVVLYLQDKGISASSIQLNGLIGAWVRSDSAEGFEKAEELAWNMIRARLDFVRMRERQASAGQSIQFYDPCNPKRTRSPNETQPEFYCVTRATAETFCILAENYCSRGLHSRLEELWGAFQDSAIGPTSFLMNQLIRSYTQEGEARRAVDIYREMTTDGSVQPDAYTFLALFNTLSVNRLAVRDPALTALDIHKSREFFSDMVRAKWTFDSPEAYHLLPRTVLFSMLKAGDYAGMVVAVRAMKELFDFTPPAPLLIELAAGTATLRVKTKRNVDRIMEADKLINGLVRQNQMRLAEEGNDLSNLTPEQKAAEVRNVLENLILHKARARDIPPEELAPLLEQAAREMSVYDIVMEGDGRKSAEHRKIVGHAEWAM